MKVKTDEGSTKIMVAGEALLKCLMWLMRCRARNTTEMMSEIHSEGLRKSGDLAAGEGNRDEARSPPP